MKPDFLKFFFFIIVLVNFGQAFSQSEDPIMSFAKTDSLLTLLKKAAPDTNKVILLNELATQLTDEHYEQALQFADSARKLSITLNYINGLRNAYYITGNIHTNYTLNFGKGIDCFTSSLKLTDESDWKRRQSIYSKLAFINKQQNNLSKSIEYYSTAISSAEKHNDVLNLVNYHSYLAEIYEVMQDMPLALQHFRKILELEKACNCESQGPIVLVSIAHYYILQKQFSLSETYYFKALACAEKTHNYRWTSYILGQLAALQSELNNDTLALDYALKGLAIAEKYKLIKETSDNRYILTAIYDSLGNYEKAYFYSKAQKQIDDSVFNMERTKEITRMQFLYETSTREEKLSALQKEKELGKAQLQKTQMILLVLIAVLVLAILLTVLLFRNYRIKQFVNKELVDKDELRKMKLDEIIRHMNSEIKEHEQTKIKLEEINTELNNFMYRSSHDLKSPLSTIIGLSNLALRSKTEKERTEYIEMILKSTVKLSTILDELLNAVLITKGNVKYTNINIADFIHEITGDLSGSEHARNVKIEIEADKDLKIQSDKTLLRTILQNVIENSMKYKNASINNPFVKITVQQQDKMLCISVSDNGQGIPQQSQAKVFDVFVRANETLAGTGLGLYLVKKAVEKLNGNIKLSSKEREGTTMEIFLPNQ